MSIHISLSIYNAVGISAYVLQQDNNLLNSFTKDELQDEAYIQSEVTNSDPSFGDYVKALFYFVGSFALGVLAVPYTLKQFGLIFPFTLYLSIPIYALYLLAIIQIISKDTFKGKQ